jgi:hypothetical protein
MHEAARPELQYQQNPNLCFTSFTAGCVSMQQIQYSLRPNETALYRPALEKNLAHESFQLSSKLRIGRHGQSVFGPLRDFRWLKGARFPPEQILGC